MYAQLCSRLCEDAPNFEPPGSTGPSTFRRLIIAKCQDEFENRSKAFAAFDKNEGPLTPYEQEQKHIAKHKMLGNIKFIGELGKLDMLHESILHRCIKQLLDKKKKQNIKDAAEDLECLCQIMKTVGPRLDTEKAKALMDQYFGRMLLLVNNEDLPARIRFMLQDTLEFRDSNWVPRKVLQDNSPKTMDQVRQEAAKCSPQYNRNASANLHMNDYGVYLPYNSNHKQSKNFFPMDDGMMTVLPQKHGGLSDVFMPTMGSSIGTGPGVIQDHFNGYTPNLGNVGGRPRSGGDSGNSRNGSNVPNQGYQNYANPKGQSSSRQDGNSNQGNQGYQNRQANQQQRDLPPRFMKKGQFNSDEISLRPARDSMVLKPQAPSMMPSSVRPAGSPQMQHSLLQPAPQMIISPQSIQTSPKAPVKHSHGGDKAKSKKQSLSKDDLKKLTENILEDYLKNGDVTEVISTLKEARVPRKQMSPMICQIMIKSLKKDDDDDDGQARERVSKLIKELKNNGIVTEDQCMESYASLLEQLSELETEMQLVKSSVAGFAARAVIDGVVMLADLATPMQTGSYYPLFLLILQQLHKLKDKEWLVQLFNESKINMQSMLPELDQSKERMMEILDDKQLSFLFPLLRMQSDISKQLKADPNPSSLYKWIKDSVDNKLHTDPEFIYALTLSLVKYCTGESTLAEGVDVSVVPDKQLQEKERALLNSLKPVLQAFIHDHVNIQLSALYALQVHCNNYDFPKGMLLRFFVYFYDLEVVEEEIFLRWKEDINDSYLGKGKALFQVNSWLTWLETADEEEESEEEDDD